MNEKLTHIDIEVNHRCNLACIHCSAQAVRGVTPNELSIFEIKKILSSASQNGLKKVGLTGGEPLIDIPKLNAIATFCLNELDIPLHTHLNGTLVNDDVCSQNGVLKLFEAISLSFLGGSSQIHDFITATNGSFDKVISACRLIIKHNLPLTCYFIPTHGTCESFLDLVPVLHEMGVNKIRPMALAPSGRARPKYGETAALKEELVQFEDGLLHYRDSLGIIIEAGNCTRLSMPKISALCGHGACMSGINRVHINSNGDVFPCTAASGVKELNLGNLRDNNFDIEEIWNESELVHLIREVNRHELEECESCPYESKCRSGCIVNTCGTMSEDWREQCPLTNHKLQVDHH